MFIRGSSVDDETSNVISDISPSSFEESTDESAKKVHTGIPDVEIMPLAVGATDDLEKYNRHFAKLGIFSLLTRLFQPKFRSSVRLATSNPQDRPKVDLGLLRDPADLAMAGSAVRLALRLGEAIKAQGFPILRGVVVPESETAGEALDDFIRRRARTTYHNSGTCRMAPESDAGVVDDELRVHGVENLRICDTSVFPQIVAAHLQAPVVMVAEKCVDMIRTREGKV